MPMDDDVDTGAEDFIDDETDVAGVPDEIRKTPGSSDGSGPRPGPSPTRARPFLEGPSPVLIEGPKPGPARARRLKPGGLEGLL